MTDDRRFHDGETFDIPPMQYRVTRGRKGPNDLRLDWRYVTDWQPVTLDHVFLIVDAIADNENVLYPLPAKGGAYVWEFVRLALKEGWRAPRNRLHIERGNKDDRRAS